MSQKVREAFRDQVRWCDQLGSPFTARVCRACLDQLSEATPIGRAILDWPGDPSAKADSFPLRVAGALHHLARSGRSADLRAAYPPHAVDDPTLTRAIGEALRDHADVVREYLGSPPQTNEVMRSAALLPGLLTIAQRTGHPLALYEIGSSAGLNLVLDRYRYEFGSARWGDPVSPLLIKPEWHGAAPPVGAALSIATRQGVDLNPVDLRDPAARDRLLSYVWPDQADRLQRLEQAMALWRRDPPLIERADAAQWLPRSTIAQPTSGVTRVLFHSVTWSYLPEATRRSIDEFMQASGAEATASAPLAWLRFELSAKGADLSLRLWPGADELLAVAHPHGTLVHWQSQAPAASTA
jgi:hypothetical protein